MYIQTHTRSLRLSLSRVGEAATWKKRGASKDLKISSVLDDILSTSDLQMSLHARTDTHKKAYRFIPVAILAYLHSRTALAYLRT